jgi:aminoglycoside phosphotransferase
MKRNPSHAGSSVGCKSEDPCSMCKAEEEADRLQYIVAQALEIPGIGYLRRQAEKWNTVS